MSAVGYDKDFLLVFVYMDFLVEVVEFGKVFLLVEYNASLNVSYTASL